MKKYLLLCLLGVLPLTSWSQVVTNDEPDDEDEIIVTDQEGNEEVIEFPEAMTYDLDSLMNLYMAKTYLEEDNDCNMRDVNPVYSREEYIERLSRMPCVMEMSYNEVVQKFIDRYSGRLRHSISYMLGASNFYMPIFEEALEMYQLPLELKYLPVIESALNPKAVSRVGAAVDERRDPQKASLAAARYLKDLYKIFGDWNLVIAAYNCGPENINKAIHRAGGEKDYWQIYPYLPKETRGYVPAFIAANYIMTYYSLHNICPMSTRLPAKSDTVVVNKNLHLQQVAEVVGINIDLLRSLNPMYRRDVIPGATTPSVLRLPLTETTRFIDLQDSVFSYKSDELLTRRSEVEVKDDVPTYYHKSKRYTRGKKGRYSRHSKASRKQAKASRKRSTVSRKRGASSSKKRKSSRRRRR